MAKRKDKKGRALPDGVSERADGRYIYRYQRYGKLHYLYAKDLNTLKQRILKLHIELEQGLNTNLANQSLKEYYPYYLETYKKGKIKEASYNNKVQHFDKYMRPFDIAHVPMKEISRQMVVKHLQYLADEKKLARGTIATLASSMKCALQEVLYDKGLLVNPFEDVMKSIDARPPKPVRALEKAEQDALISFLSQENTWQNVHLPLIGFLLGTGVRVGEAMALTWDDIDLKSKTVKIYKTMNYRDRGLGDGKKEYYITTPKTENAYREIPLSSQVIKLIEQQKQYQKDLRIRQDIEIPEYNMRGRIVKTYKGFVFTTRMGYPYSDGIASNLRRIVNSYNKEETHLASEEGREPLLLPPIHAHMLRHTFCTRLVESQLEKGITDYQAVKYLMGHSKIQTSIDVYTSVSKELQKNYASDVEGIINLKKM